MNIQRIFFVICTVLFLSGTMNAQSWTPKFERFTLKNGLNVILHRDTLLPLISLSMAYKAGSAADKPGKTGVAQIVGEHLFAGTKNVPKEVLFELRSKHNALIQAMTSVDWTNLSTTIAMNSLETAIMIEADRMENLLTTVTDETVDAAIQRIREEHKSRAQRPLGNLNANIFHELYNESHPYRHLTIGDKDDLDSITVSDVLSFIRDNYQPDNASLTIGGNFETSEARNLVEKYFGKITPRNRPRQLRYAPSFTPFHTGAIILEDNIRFNQLILVFPTIANNHPDEPALRLFTNILAGSSEAVLNKVLAEKLPSFISVDVSHSTQEYGGTFWITVTTKMDTPLQSIYETVMHIIEEFVKTGVSDDDLVAARNKLSIEFYSPLEQFYGFGGRCDLLNLANLLKGNPLFNLNQFHEALTVNSASLQQVINTYLTSNNQLIVNVLPSGKSKQAVVFE